MTAEQVTVATVRMSPQGLPWVSLGDGQIVATSVATVTSLGATALRPLSIIAADLNRDGTNDLITGYAADGGGLLVIYLGQPYNDDTAQAAAYAPEPRSYRLPVTPQAMGAGDLDADGHMDVVVASLGSESLWLLPGRGAGDLDEPRALALPGGLTALAVGELNRRDGLEDLAVAVAGPGGAQVLIYQNEAGAWFGTPEAHALPAPASDLAIGQLDDQYPYDLAIAAGSTLVIVRGHDRGLDAPAAEPAAYPLGYRALALAVGDLIAGDDGAPEIAILGADGRVRVLAARDPGAQGTELSLATGALPDGPTDPRPMLLRAKLSSLAADDLLLVGGGKQGLQILNADGRRYADGGLAPAAPAGVLATIEAEGAAIAAVPARLNADALDDLVTLVEGAAAPVVSLLEPVRTFAVSSPRDEPDKNPGDGRCETAVGSWSCTLRAAIQEANASPGVDRIEFRLQLFERTIAPLSALPAITEVVTIDGLGIEGRQFGYVNVDGSQAGTGVSGLDVRGNYTTLDRLNVYGYSGYGVLLGGSGAHTVHRCRIGTDNLGTPGLGNRAGGVQIYAGSGTALISTTVVSNDYHGVLITGGSEHEILRNNSVGLLPSATTALPNAQDGIHILSGPNHVVGATSLRNTISGNRRHGVYVGPGASGVQVYNNHIGVAADGTTLVGNRSYGVLVDGAASTTVGYNSSFYRNGIGGNLIGVFVQGAGATSALVRGNHIGIDLAEATVIPQIGFGVYVRSSAPAVEVSSNYIGGNRSHGILIAGDPEQTTPPCSRHVIRFNRIGTTNDGLDLGNQGHGIRVSGSSCNTIMSNEVAYNTIGIHIEGTDPISASMVSNNVHHNREYGIVVDTDGNVIEATTLAGNIRGGMLVNGAHNQLLRNEAYGLSDRPQLIGIEIRGSDNAMAGGGTLSTVLSYNEVGLLLSGDRNVIRNYAIRDNSGPGIQVEGHSNILGGAGNDRLWLARNTWGVRIEPGASGNQLLGSRIGVDIAGSGGEVYGTYGVIVQGSHNVIGGDAGAGNVIGSFSGAGIMLHGPGATDNQVRGNRIGVDASGGAVGNWEGGILISGGASRNAIESNWIANNGLAGIQVESGTRNSLLSNTLHDNERLGIDLWPAGVTHNDTGDHDTGANALQNYPVVAAAIAGSALRIQGTQSSAASRAYRLHFYLNAACDPSGFGEGETLLGQMTVATDGAGRAGYDITFSVADALGKFVTATATDPEGNTSEFSRCAVGRPATGGAAFVVNTSGDAVDTNLSDGICDSSAAAGEQCTLRAAVQQANASVGADTIILPAGTYTLTLSGSENQAASGDLDITDHLTLIGAGADVTIIESAVADRVLEVRNGAQVSLSGVTVRGGNITTTASGGGILVGGVSDTGVQLTLEAVSVQGNATGGAGGGIYSYGTLNVSNSAVVQNSAVGDGGGLALLIGSATLENTTVSGNSTRGHGGGIYNVGASVRLNNVTVTENTADSDANGGDGGGLYTGASTFYLQNSIVAQNVDSSAGTYPYGQADCAGEFTSEDYNLIGDSASRAGCTFIGSGSHDSIGGYSALGRYLRYNAGLGPLQLNGGTTPNHMPIAQAAGWTVDWGNPATPNGTGGACEPFDQRGQPRPVDGGTDGIAVCDRGAVEHVPAYLSIGDATVAEGSAASFEVSLSAPAQIAFTVQYATSDLTAVAGQDYTSTSGTLSFEPDQTMQTVTVSTLSDTLNEESETFRVRLEYPAWVQIADGEGIGTILDGDPVPALMVGDASATEGDPGAGGQAVVPVTLNSPSGKAVTVDYALQAGTAVADEDYVHSQGTLTFAPGVTSQQVVVNLIGDDLQEANETLTLVLHNPVNASIGDGTGVITIMDDDLLAFAIADASRWEGNSGTGEMRFTVRLTKPSTQPVTVAFSTSPGTATAGSDYAHSSGVLTFGAGETAKTLVAVIYGDTEVEPDETLLVTLSSPTGGATIAVGTATGTILDDDGAELRLFAPLILRR